MKLTIFMIVMCFLLAIAKVTTGFYIDKVPLFAVFQTPLTIFMWITGGVAAGLILLKTIKEIKEIFTNGRKDKE